MKTPHHPLRVWRFERDLKLADVAKLAGISIFTIGAVERGDIPVSARTAAAIKRATKGAIILEVQK